ncbi:hypothetical protein [Myxococcus sp. Y35]|uniref:hypothetical protein n=1 Tax=Pseudomyxococcus flavus TaxID=3115648 RepID=UPI003CF4619F
MTNQLIREALHPYREGLVIATKVGAVRGPHGSWEPAFTPADLERAVHDNLRHLGLEVLDVVNFRAMFSAEGLMEAPSRRRSPRSPSFSSAASSATSA